MREPALMKKPQGIPHFTSSDDFERYLPTAPLLSSREAGWESIMVRSYHEPADLEETFFPGGPDLYLVLITSGTVRVDERKIYSSWKTSSLQKGDWFLTPPGGEPYTLRWKSLSSDPLETLHLHLSADLFARTVRHAVKHGPTHVMVQELTGFRDPLLMQLALSLQQELQHPAFASLGKLYAETAAHMLAMHLLRHYTTSTVLTHDGKGKLSSCQMQHITSFILDHLSQNLSLEMLAQQIGFSPYHFARLFRQTTGESPHRFVLRQRLAVAQRLLKETDLPLIHVAAEVGIPNQSHFTQVFKHHTGRTPFAYRRNVKVSTFPT